MNLTPQYDPLLDDIRCTDDDSDGITYDPYLEEFRMKDENDGIVYDALLDETRASIDPTVAAVITGLVLSNITESTIDYAADVVCDIETLISVEISLNEDMTDPASVAHGTISGNTTINGQLTELTPGTTVYVRIKAINAGGTSYSAVTQGGLLNGFPSSNKILSTFADHIIGLWPLNDTSGITALDVSGRGNNAKYVGTINYVQTGIGSNNSAQFTTNAGLNLYSSGLSSLFNGNEGFASFVVNPVSILNWSGTQKYIMYLTTDESANRIMLSVTSDSFVLFHIAGGVARSIAMPSPNTKSWYILSVRWSKTTGQLDFLINGVIVKSYIGTLGTWAGSLLSYGAVLFKATDSSSYFACNALQCFLLDYAPSISEIQSLYNPIGFIEFEGDSRTANYYWQFAATSLALPGVNGFGFEKWGVNISAVSGSTVSTLDSRKTTVNAKLLNNKINVIVVWIGVNNSASTPQFIYDSIKAYCLQARAAGWDKIVICSEVDGQAVMNYHDNIWHQLNDLIYADHSFADALADLGADVRLQDATNTTYFLPDKVHLAEGGKIAVGEIVGNCLATLI